MKSPKASFEYFGYTPKEIPMSTFGPIDDGPHLTFSSLATGGVRQQLTGAMPRQALVPQCVRCSRAHAEQTGMPANVAAASALIFRAGRTPSTLRYGMLVRCHGASEIVDLGEDTPTDRQILNWKAFTHVEKVRPPAKHGNVRRSARAPSRGG